MLDFTENRFDVIRRTGGDIRENPRDLLSDLLLIVLQKLKKRWDKPALYDPLKS